MGQEWTPPPGPGEHHKKLEPFVGTFRAEVKLYFGEGEPMVHTGEMTNSWALDGRFLEQVYKGDEMDGPFGAFQGRGFWGYNDGAGEYEGFWIDTASNVMMHESGAGDAKTWTMSGDFKDPCQGQTMAKRTVITLVDNDHHTMEQFMTMPDGTEKKSMEITYTRA